jgi:pimeloyl-ACP methyl ester carboxylesterase
MMPHIVSFFENALGSTAKNGDREDVRRALYRFMYALSGDAPQQLLRTLFSRGGMDIQALRRVEPPQLPPDWLTDADLDYYAAEFARTGFDGVVSRYRNLVRDWEDSADVAGAVIRHPALFIGGERDSAVVFSSLEPMKKAVPSLRNITILADCSHWVQQERAADASAALVEFLSQERASCAGHRMS